MAISTFLFNTVLILNFLDPIPVDSSCEVSLNYQLVQYVCNMIEEETLKKFIRIFLLESNTTSVRWQAHSLVYHIYR